MGYNKTMLYLGGLALAVAGPIGMFRATDMARGIRKSWAPNANATTNATSQQPNQADSPTGGAVASPLAGSPARASDTRPLPTLEEVLRFDVTVEWVMQRWPRVSAGLPHLQLRGYRVALVTGGKMTDVAGSLTYYFNAGQTVERITLRGTTGDPTRLVQVVASRYHFARRLTNDPGLVLLESVDANNQPAGTLKMRSADIIKASQPYSRYTIDLVIDRQP